MIETFRDQATKDIFNALDTKASRTIPSNLHGIVRRKLAMIDYAHEALDLRVPPGNRLEKLAGTTDVWSIRVNDQYRITFQFEGGNAREVCCTDYH